MNETTSIEENVISIGLTLPTKPSRVILLICTDKNMQNVLIDEREVNEMQVSKVLSETSSHNKKVLIFQCKLWEDSNTTVCLKLMNNNDIYQNEKLAYEKMIASDVTNIFLKVYFFCEVILPDKKLWKGYCMQEGNYSIRDILFPVTSDAVSLALEQKKILKQIIQDKEKALKKINSPENSFEMGMKVIFKPDQTIQMSIIIAALRLLHRMHTEYRWVHGDSHLGNFMYLDGKIYAIDFERSFATQDKVLHLLDIQEFFGHCSGILLHQIRNNSWDMRDIFGIYYYRHPLLSRGGGIAADDCWYTKSSNFSRRKTLYMLPVCFCFTSNNEALRTEGCAFCKSHTNTLSASFVSERFNEVINDLSDWGLMKLKSGLNYTRTNTIMKQCCSMADLIYPCIQDGQVLTMRLPFINNENKRRRLDNDTLLNVKLITEITKSKQSFVSALKRLLYMPVINERANDIVKEIVTRLKHAGFEQAGNTLWINTAAVLTAA
jgi:hypothetical protein